MGRGVVLSLEFAVMCDACQNMERVWLSPFCVVDKGVTVTSFLSGSFIWTRPASPWNSFIVIPEISMWLNGFILSRYACISSYEQIKCSGKRLHIPRVLDCFVVLSFCFYFPPFSWYALQKDQALLERVDTFLNSVWYSLMDCLWGPQCSCDCSILKRVMKLQWIVLAQGCWNCRETSCMAYI